MLIKLKVYSGIIFITFLLGMGCTNTKRTSKGGVEGFKTGVWITSKYDDFLPFSYVVSNGDYVYAGITEIPDSRNQVFQIGSRILIHDLDTYKFEFVFDSLYIMKNGQPNSFYKQMEFDSLLVKMQQEIFNLKRKISDKKWFLSQRKTGQFPYDFGSLFKGDSISVGFKDNFMLFDNGVEKDTVSYYFNKKNIKVISDDYVSTYRFNFLEDSCIIIKHKSSDQAGFLKFEKR